MVRREFTFPSADGKTPIHAVEWVPDGPVRAVVQISHGVAEHILRYEALASWLTERGIACEHEVRLAPRCRIDVMCGGVGIEIKRGKPEKSRLMAQLTRYAACGQVEALIVVCERSVDLPRTVCGKPVKALCLNRLWGIAL